MRTIQFRKAEIFNDAGGGRTARVADAQSAKQGQGPLWSSSSASASLRKGVGKNWLSGGQSAQVVRVKLRMSE